jgi:DNA-binding CsgD family transcriptional regulator
MGTAPYQLTQARLVDARDGSARALEQIRPLANHATRLKRLLVVDPTAAPFVVRTAVAVGNRAIARAAVTAAERLAARNPDFAVLGAAAAQARGLFDNDPAKLELAVSGHRHPWAQASATEDLAALLALQAPNEGRRRYEQAVADYLKSGASRDATRTQSRRRALDTRRRRSRSTGPVSGWESLSDQETSVARLVAQGLSNPQVAERLFLSRHTVDFHLRQIFRKLDVSSRVELVRLYVDQQRNTERNPD